jgi:hypothetical protein
MEYQIPREDILRPQGIIIRMYLSGTGTLRCAGTVAICHIKRGSPSKLVTVRTMGIVNDTSTTRPIVACICGLAPKLANRPKTRLSGKKSPLMCRSGETKHVLNTALGLGVELVSLPIERMHEIVYTARPWWGRRIMDLILLEIVTFCWARDIWGKP